MGWNHTDERTYHGYPWKFDKRKSITLPRGCQYATILAMDRHKRHATTVRLDESDREALECIKQLYGCPSDNAAIKLALRMLAPGASSQRVFPIQAPNKERSGC